MNTDFEHIKSINYLLKEAECDPFKWLLDYCNAIPDVAKHYIDNIITNVYEAPSAEDMKVIIEYFRGFGVITSSYTSASILRSSNSEIKSKYTALCWHSDEEIEALRDKLRQLLCFFYEGNRYTYYHRGPKYGDNHPTRKDEDGIELPLAIFDSPLECFVSSLGHTFNAMCSQIYYLSKSKDREQYARYAALAQYVFKSFYEVYCHIAAKQFEANVDVYIIPSSRTILYKYVANSFKYIDTHGKERTYWYRDAMYTGRIMLNAFKHDEPIYKCDDFKIW